MVIAKIITAVLIVQNLIVTILISLWKLLDIARNYCNDYFNTCWSLKLGTYDDSNGA